MTVTEPAARGQLSGLEHALKSAQVDLEKCQFALEVKKGAGPATPCLPQKYAEICWGRGVLQCMSMRSGACPHATMRCHSYPLATRLCQPHI